MTALLFWIRTAVLRKMLDDLKAYEKSRGRNSPAIVVISKGPSELNQSMDLESTILLDDSFTAGMACGVRGTPSALLIDENGNVASPVAVGASNIMSLLSSNSQEDNVHNAVGNERT
jgi:hypothetical protein